MPEMIPRHSIKIHRKDQEPFYPVIGVPFNFTNEEIRAIRTTKHDALRLPAATTARTDTEAGRGAELPDADDTRDANVLGRAKANAGGSARNQGGSLEEADIARGKLGKTPNSVTDTKRANVGKKDPALEESGTDDEDDEL